VRDLTRPDLDRSFHEAILRCSGSGCLKNIFYGWRIKQGPFILRFAHPDGYQSLNTYSGRHNGLYNMQQSP
jgi:hypothetical protein